MEIEEAFTNAFDAPLRVADRENIVEVEKDSIQSNLNEEDYYLNLTIDFVLTQRSIKLETGDDIEHIGVEIDNEHGQKIEEDYTDEVEEQPENNKDEDENVEELEL